MIYSPALVLHICGGIAGVLSSLTALVARKGARLHRIAGDVFVVSMLVMAASGVYLAVLRSQRINTMAGVFTFYLVTTAWLTVQRKEKVITRMETGFSLVPLAVGAAGLLFAWEASQKTAGKGGIAAAYLIFSAIALLSAGGDLRLLLRGGLSNGQRLVRHLWRMGFASFIAVGSFFLGRASDPVLRQTGLRARLFNDAVRQTHLPAVPVLFVVVVTLYWLVRVKLANRKRRMTAAAQPGGPLLAVAERP